MSATLIVADVEFSSWYGLLGPAGIPPAIVEKINASLIQATSVPFVKDKIVQQGIEPKTMPSAEFTTLLTNHYDLMKRVVRAAGLVKD